MKSTSLNNNHYDKSEFPYLHWTPPTESTQLLITSRQEFIGKSRLDGVDSFKHTVTTLNYCVQLLRQQIADNVWLSAGFYVYDWYQQFFQLFLFTDQHDNEL